MAVKADLHMHSTFSDGVLQPEELVRECVGLGIQMMALTDHDTFDGSDRLRAQWSPIPVLPAVELSMRDTHGLHLLGYGMTEAQPLRARVKELSALRLERAHEIVRRLEKLGMPLDWEDLLARCNGSVGRPHIARAMVRAGYVATMQEGFTRHLSPGCPAYVSGERMNMQEALALLRENGFVPVLAHPRELKLEDQLLVPLLEKWKEQGLMGL